MNNFQIAMQHLQTFCAKNDVVAGASISIVLESEEDRALFLRGVKAEIDFYNVDVAADGGLQGEFEIVGFRVRVLSK
jgi:hypothetical protein